MANTKRDDHNEMIRIISSVLSIGILAFIIFLIMFNGASFYFLALPFSIVILSSLLTNIPVNISFAFDFIAIIQIFSFFSGIAIFVLLAFMRDVRQDIMMTLVAIAGLLTGVGFGGGLSQFSIKGDKK